MQLNKYLDSIITRRDTIYGNFIFKILYYTFLLTILIVQKDLIEQKEIGEVSTSSIKKNHGVEKKEH